MQRQFLQNLFCRFCLDLEEPPVNIDVVEDDITVTSLGELLKLRDLGYFIKYCRSKALLYSVLGNFCSIFTLIFGLTTQRTLIRVSSILYLIFGLLHTAVILLSGTKMLKAYLYIVFTTILFGLTMFLYWLALQMLQIRFWVILSNFLNIFSITSYSVCTFFIGRIQTVYHFIPQEYHSKL